MMLKDSLYSSTSQATLTTKKSDILQLQINCFFLLQTYRLTIMALHHLHTYVCVLPPSYLYIYKIVAVLYFLLVHFINSDATKSGKDQTRLLKVAAFVRQNSLKSRLEKHLSERRKKKKKKNIRAVFCLGYRMNQLNFISSTKTFIRFHF